MDLTGVPETALLTLLNRAVEAGRPDAVLHDPEAIALLERLGGAQRFTRFGPTTRLGSRVIALRARVFDDELRRFVARRPGTTVVALGEGLQTSFWRLRDQWAGDDGLRWLTVDLPEIIELRRRLLPAHERLRTFAGSALDRAWAAEVDPGAPVVISAEGLLMYLPPDDVLGLIRDCAARFPGGAMMFDTIPSWISATTLDGARFPSGYAIPPMPFHLSRREAAQLPRTVAGIAAVRDVTVPTGGVLTGVARLLWDLPVVRDVRPTITFVQFAE